MVVITGHETAKVGSFMATYFLVKLVAMKLPRSAVSWPLLIGAESGHKTAKVGSLRAGVHKTGIRGIQDTRQIVDGKTNDIENNNKKGGAKPLT